MEGESSTASIRGISEVSAVRSRSRCYRCSPPNAVAAHEDCVMRLSEELDCALGGNEAACHITCNRLGAHQATNSGELLHESIVKLQALDADGDVLSELR